MPAPPPPSPPVPHMLLGQVTLGTLWDSVVNALVDLVLLLNDPTQNMLRFYRFLVKPTVFERENNLLKYNK